MYRVLVVEDDKVLCDNIKEGISRWGFEGIAVENFADILQEFARFPGKPGAAYEQGLQLQPGFHGGRSEFGQPGQECD